MAEQTMGLQGGVNLNQVQQIPTVGVPIPEVPVEGGGNTNPAPALYNQMMAVLAQRPPQQPPQLVTPIQGYQPRNILPGVMPWVGTGNALDMTAAGPKPTLIASDPGVMSDYQPTPAQMGQPQQQQGYQPMQGELYADPGPQRFRGNEIARGTPGEGGYGMPPGMAQQQGYPPVAPQRQMPPQMPPQMMQPQSPFDNPYVQQAMQNNAAMQQQLQPYIDQGPYMQLPAIPPPVPTSQRPGLGNFFKRMAGNAAPGIYGQQQAQEYAQQVALYNHQIQAQNQLRQQQAQQYQHALAAQQALRNNQLSQATNMAMAEYHAAGAAAKAMLDKNLLDSKDAWQMGDNLNKQMPYPTPARYAIYDSWREKWGDMWPKAQRDAVYQTAASQLEGREVRTARGKQEYELHKAIDPQIVQKLQTENATLKDRADILAQTKAAQIELEKTQAERAKFELQQRKTYGDAQAQADLSAKSAAALDKERAIANQIRQSHEATIADFGKLDSKRLAALLGGQPNEAKSYDAMITQMYGSRVGAISDTDARAQAVNELRAQIKNFNPATSKTLLDKKVAEIKAANPGVPQAIANANKWLLTNYGYQASGLQQGYQQRRMNPQDFVPQSPQPAPGFVAPPRPVPPTAPQMQAMQPTVQHWQESRSASPAVTIGYDIDPSRKPAPVEQAAPPMRRITRAGVNKKTHEMSPVVSISYPRGTR